MKILFDTSVRLHGIIGVFAFENVTVPWGDTLQELPILRAVRRPDRHGNQTWLKQQVECLPTIGRLIRENKIKAYKSSEIMWEWARTAKIGQASYYAFENCRFEDADSPIERSKLFQSDFRKHATVEGLRDFCKWLMQLNHEHIPTLLSSPIADRFTEFEKSNFLNLKLLVDICRDIEEKHYPDAFHLWTVEANNFDFYLTTDKTFINEWTQKSKAKLKCQMISPRELLVAMGINQLDPIPLQHGTYYSLVNEEVFKAMFNED